METDANNNPWLGLESYQEGEILYGRDDDIRDLIQCVLNDVDTLLYGKSGIGKSSLLNAGILPAARRNSYLPVLIRLSHKEGNNYLSQIRNAIIASMDLSDSDKGEIVERIKKVAECKDEKKESLYEFFHRHTFHDSEGNRIKLLLIFDQFEEIFTLQSDEAAKRAFFAQMADTLNDIMPDDIQQTLTVHNGPKELINTDDANADSLFDEIDFDVKDSIPEYVNDNVVHFVFTIREDFLSEFEYYTASIPSLKQNRYGLRPINDEQASQIILRPRPGLISQSVAKLIIEKVTGRTDFEIDGIPEIEVDSAVLSLYLNRLYEAKNSDIITSDLVEQKGGGIISDFYKEAISEISQSSIEYLENMLINGQGRRDNITVYDAIHEGGVSENELDILCNRNKILRQFNYAGVLRIEYIHDILCPIVIERKECREEENRIKQIEAIAKEEKIQSKKRLTVALTALCLLAIGISAFFTYDWYFHSYEKKAYHIAYQLRNGWPVGVGPELSESERNRLPVYYELSHPGHAKQQYSKVRVCSSNSIIDQQRVLIPMLLTDIIPSDSVPDIMYEMQSKIRSVLFSPTADTKQDKAHPVLDNMAFFDEGQNLLFTVKYSRDTKNGVWYKFYTDNGQPMSINMIDRINVITDPTGYISSAVYYDGDGVKRHLWDNVYGYVQNETLSDSSFYNVVDRLCVTTVNQFNQPTDNRANTIQTVFNKDNVTFSYFHKDYDSDKLQKVTNANGYASAVLTYNQYDYYGLGTKSPIASMKVERDKKGNIIKTTLSDPHQALVSMPFQTKFSYDNSGRITSKEMHDSHGRPFSPSHAIYKYVYGYSDKGELLMHHEVADTGLVYIYKKQALAKNVISVTQGGLAKKSAEFIPFHIRVDSILSQNKTISHYYDLEHRPINYVGIDLKYHKMVAIKTKYREEYAYYQILDGMIVPMNESEPYFRQILQKDKDGNVLSYRNYNLHDDIIQSMCYYYDNGRMIGRSVMGIDNTPVRCDRWDEDGFLYYKLFFNQDFNGDFTDFKAINEFTQPALIYCERLGYFNIRYGNFRNSYLDFDNSVIKSLVRLPIQKDYWQYYPENSSNQSNVRITYIHLLNKNNILYKQGLRDGDVIYSCGSWRIGGDEDILSNQLARYNVLTVFKLENGKYRKKVIRLPRVLNTKDLQSVHFHNMQLSTYEHLPNIR